MKGQLRLAFFNGWRLESDVGYSSTLRVSREAQQKSSQKAALIYGVLGLAGYVVTAVTE
ncbi:hypothetical protein [Photobacterium kagoshimensis]|uniref:hypothetical protein n=1 Tax=Photobacterium kagoshimensis TaxID=2910242 RepID=UPI003D11EB36